MIRNPFERMTISKRLVIGFGLLIFLLASSGLYTLYNLKELDDHQKIFSQSSTDITSNSVLAGMVANAEMGTVKWVMPLVDTQNALHAYLVSENSQERTQLLKDIHKYESQMVSMGNDISNQVTSDDGTAQLTAIQHKLPDLKKASDAVVAANQHEGRFGADSKAKWAAFTKVAQLIRSDMDGLQKTLAAEFTDHDKKREDGLGTMDNSIIDSVAIIARAIHINIVLIASCIAIAFIVTMLIYRSIVRPLSRATKLAGRIANYDLVFRQEDKEAQSTGKDELSRLLNDIFNMRTSLHDLVQKITSLTGNLSGSITEFSDNAKNINKIGDDQLSYTTRSAAAVEEMASSIKEVARSAAEASTYATEADNSASNCMENEATVTLTEMSKVQSEVESTSDKIQLLSHSAEEVGDIVRVISEIAEQTNLLALNAAIEAARAGEQGRGFAVVADEVRNLAQRTKQSTDDISEKIRRIQTETRDAIDNMMISRKSVEHSAEVVNGIIDSLRGIQQVNQQLRDLNLSVATATEQQSTASDEVASNLHEVQMGAQALSEHATHIDDQAGGMAKLVTDLKTTVEMFKIV